LKKNLKPIHGNWVSGFVLDKHTIISNYIGDNEYGHPQYHTIRTEIGEALYQLKNQHDWNKVEPLAEELYSSVFPRFPEIGLIIPVPASINRTRQPVYEIAKSFARKCNLNYYENIVQKSPRKAGEPQLKNLNTKEEKKAVLAGKFSINDEIQGNGRWNVLVVDDLFHTGASLEAVCAALATYPKVANIHVTALTWR